MINGPDLDLDPRILDRDIVRFAIAWHRLKMVVPDAPMVKIILRRKTGQVFCQVGKVQRTGRTEAEAIAAVAAAIGGR